jgi:RNA polymerase sigma-70 factor (ECF subfamily)
MNDQWQQVFHSNHDLEPVVRQDLFRQLWENWWPRLRVYLGGFSGLTAEDAEELASDALLRAMERADSYDPKRAFEPWLYTLARNLAIGRQRQQKRRREAATDPARLDRTEGKSRLEENLILEEIRNTVAQAVVALPERERELACLVYGAGLGLMEAARITGEPLGTVKWRIYRLKAIIRSKMEDTDAR